MSKQRTQTNPTIQHPLEPLTVAEMAQAVSILRSERELGESFRFVSSSLHEPSKETVLSFKEGDSIQREAFFVLLDNAEGITYEAIVSLTEEKVVSWNHIPGVQPAIMPDEFAECEEAVRSHPEFQVALKKRGITDVDGVMVDPWSAGFYGSEEEGQRIIRGLCFYRTSPLDNGYARPIEGLIAVVDASRKEVIRIEDHGAVPLPPLPGNYTPDEVGRLRSDLKPLEINQPEGPSFVIEGHKIMWQKWHIRFGFTPREGLVLHTVHYEDQGRLRPVLYRASVSEMVVPYGDPSPMHNRKNAFDSGEYGIGILANSLRLGCDCLGEIRYFDAVMTDSRGNVAVIPNAVCLHEEDYGILWKHTDWRTGHVEVRRSRRLVLSFICTVENYEYGFFWYFYQDGNIEFEAKLTGIISTGALPPGQKPKYGTLVAPQLYGPIHQHFFNLRLDMMIDGTNNSIYEVHTEAEPLGPQNPLGNAFFAKSTLLKTEAEAQQNIDPFTARFWKIVNPSVLNAVGEPVGYKIVQGETVPPFAHKESSLMKRAGFLDKQLWVTPYDEKEKYAAGDYPNQHPGRDGLPKWTASNRSIENTNIVVWYTIGSHHVVRPEDWPVMPAAYAGFCMKPVGFFDRNPALDVPPSKPKHTDCCP
ncbi:primary-amine oxidase [Ammoniphilus sp. 3BR4]|uniref:primary-amine oxidase n=1 Tax=Ammoniphilus sp. 3BR4 TaxID=3158265 RepID=UPI003467D4B8